LKKSGDVVDLFYSFRTQNRARRRKSLNVQERPEFCITRYEVNNKQLCKAKNASERVLGGKVSRRSSITGTTVALLFLAAAPAAPQTIAAGSSACGKACDCAGSLHNGRAAELGTPVPDSTPPAMMSTEVAAGTGTGGFD
jgi:hypothetical protein